MFRDLSVSNICAGLIAVIVGFSSSAVVVFQAAEAAGASGEQAASWLWALGLGIGITSIGLSLQHRIPLVTAWSTPGAAALIASLAGFSLEQAIGAFVMTAVLILLAGWSGQFERLTRSLSPAIANAMLAGVLLPFGIRVFSAITEQPVLVLSMIGSYFLFRLWQPKYAVLVVAVLGLVVAWMQGQIQVQTLSLSFGYPVWQSPEFSLRAFLSLTVPLFLVTMASQNLPGIAVLVSSGYRAPSSSMLKWTGATTLMLAPFGAFALNLAAITAAICVTEDAHADKDKRYIAAISAGVFYLLLGVMAGTVVAFFASVPAAYLATLAGLALLPTIASSLLVSLCDEEDREAALVTLLATVSGVVVFGIGSAFWGMVMGYLVHWRRGILSCVQWTK
ncbi:benzoate/H(+) symporter BenE family transporter [Gynuella sp.]|uniref:benzoate/H(+) symporter BenE family transporter n=1 Tax=Gynuella sp. TaxID=2969146 RepID=UPI003D124729